LGAESNLRARSTVTVIAAISLLFGSFIFTYEGGPLIMGLIGAGIAFFVVISSTVFNLKDAVFIAGSDTIIRRILLGQLTESIEISEELDKLIARYKARSATTEGLEIVKGTIEKR
jgi:hypothetical protein